MTYKKKNNDIPFLVHYSKTALLHHSRTNLLRSSLYRFFQFSSDQQVAYDDK